MIAVNDAPVLDNSGSPTLTAIFEDATNPSGTPVFNLVSGIVMDPDPAALKGIGVVAAANTSGTWQFTLDNGATWQSMGTVSAQAARLLPSDTGDKIREFGEDRFHHRRVKGVRCVQAAGCDRFL